MKGFRLGCFFYNKFIIIIIVVIIIIIYAFEFFTSALADGLSLEFE